MKQDLNGDRKPGDNDDDNNDDEDDDDDDDEDLDKDNSSAGERHPSIKWENGAVKRHDRQPDSNPTLQGHLSSQQKPLFQVPMAPTSAYQGGVNCSPSPGPYVPFAKSASSPLSPHQAFHHPPSSSSWLSSEQQQQQHQQQQALPLPAVVQHPGYCDSNAAGYGYIPSNAQSIFSMYPFSYNPTSQHTLLT